MLTETARQCLHDLGLSEERREQVASLLEENRNAEARLQLRKLRCDLMDDMHRCQRRVDQLDWLIRETEKTDRPCA